MRKKNAVEKNTDAPLDDQRRDALWGRIERSDAAAWAHQSLIDWRLTLPRAIPEMATPDLLDPQQHQAIQRWKTEMADEILFRLQSNDADWFQGVSDFLRHSTPQPDLKLRPVDFERTIIFSMMEGAAMKGKPLPTNAEIRDELVREHERFSDAGVQLDPLCDESQQRKIAKAARDSFRKKTL